MSVFLFGSSANAMRLPSRIADAKKSKLIGGASCSDSYQTLDCDNCRTNGNLQHPVYINCSISADRFICLPFSEACRICVEAMPFALCPGVTNEWAISDCTEPIGEYSPDCAIEKWDVAISTCTGDCN